MTSLNWHPDQQLESGWLRSARVVGVPLPGDDLDGLRRMRQLLLSEREGEPLIVTRAQRDWATDYLHLRYLRTVGMGVEMSAFVFRNIMDLWPPDVSYETVQLLSRKQLEKAFGPVFGPLLADALGKPEKQPMLARFVHRKFDNWARREFQMATLVWSGGPVNVDQDLGAVPQPEAEELVSRTGGYTLLTHQRFSPEHEFYAAVVKSGQALWEALGHLD